MIVMNLVRILINRSPTPNEPYRPVLRQPTEGFLYLILRFNQLAFSWCDPAEAHGHFVPQNRTGRGNVPQPTNAPDSTSETAERGRVVKEILQ